MSERIDEVGTTFVYKLRKESKMKEANSEEKVLEKELKMVETKFKLNDRQRSRLAFRLRKVKEYPNIRVASDGRVYEVNGTTLLRAEKKQSKAEKKAAKKERVKELKKGKGV